MLLKDLLYLVCVLIIMRLIYLLLNSLFVSLRLVRHRTKSSHHACLFDQILSSIYPEYFAVIVEATKRVVYTHVLVLIESPSLLS